MMDGDEPQGGRHFRRDPGMPFDDFRVEQYAKARAKGGTIAASGSHAGVVKGTALKWEKEPEVRARVRELRDGAEDFVGVSVAWIIGELKRNAKEARENNAFKASNEALLITYKIISENKQVAHQMAAALPAALEGKDLQKALRESFSQPEDVIEGHLVQETPRE